ncbi:hypothetical protein FNV43_RR15413 [Rhamnella rubrinervis]|uniref:DUF4378 domain-containing protein n=1 Tax=Rhamnella rubrinervis TaxID=2594499 RepID=A0A8K0E8U7_9ROSA|nr:hypothetical protein FNV43_RR15413 [Rhamnella rubrinervis]
MAKGSQRRSVRYEKDQSGCMWGLISMFDFRNGRSSRKLLSDRRHGSRHGLGPGFSSNKFEILSNLDENCQGTSDVGENTAAKMKADARKPSVKKLIEEEMFNEQDTKKETINAEVEHKQSESAHEGQTRTDHKRAKKTRKKSRDMDAHNLNGAENLQSECHCNQNRDQPSIKNLGIDEIIEEFCNQIHQKNIDCTKHDPNGEATVPSSHKHSDFEEKLCEVVKGFIKQKFSDGKNLTEDQKILQSRELMDALELISSDNELFLKLLQDPNSLFVKYVQKLQDAKVKKDDETKSPGVSDLERNLVNFEKSEKLVSHKKRNFFRRKVRSQGKDSSKANELSEASNRIVILKPGPPGLRNSQTESSLGSSPQSHSILRNKGPNDRLGSHFFFAEIKRKLKNAIGKQQHEISTFGMSSTFRFKSRSVGDGEKGVGLGNVGMNSPSKEHFFIERVARPTSGSKRADKTGKMKDSELRIKPEADGFPNQKISNIYVEAKKHLSEMLSNGDEIVDLSSRQIPKSLGRILSLPEYNRSPIGSPGRDWDDGFVTAQMRFSANNNKLSPKREKNVSPLGRGAQYSESQSPICDNSPDYEEQAPKLNPSISDDVVHDIKVEEIVFSIEDEISPKGDSEIVEEESIILDVPSEPNCSSSTIRDDQNGDICDICDDERNSECMKQDSEEDKELQSSPIGSPSHSFTTKKFVDVDSAIDIPERPSPVSVLDPLFSEDDMSPTNTCQPANLTIQPLRIQFEELDSSTASQANMAKTFIEDKESIFDYVKAVIQASGLSLDELCTKLLYSEQLLEPSLVDNVEFFSNQICCDQKLLFDCINEVLMEMCEYYFGCTPWVSCVLPRIRPIPNMRSAILEVSEGVNWHLLQLPLPRTLDQIVRKDLARTGTWLDVRLDIETIGFDMGDVILEDLMEDTILTFLDVSPTGEHAAILELK